MHHPSRKFAFKQSKFYENYAKKNLIIFSISEIEQVEPGQAWSSLRQAA
jgi:hypothetical protein